MRRAFTIMAISASGVALAILTVGPPEPRPRIDSRNLRLLRGASEDTHVGGDNCFNYVTLATKQVKGTDCIGHDSSYSCVTCGPYFVNVTKNGQGKGVYAGIMDCSKVKKQIGTCTDGTCTKLVDSGFCEKSTTQYNTQTD